MTPPPHRHWPTRLRHALRRRLAERDLAIPAGMRIRYGPGARRDEAARPRIEARHSPDATEWASVHDIHEPFAGETDLETVLDMLERHALAMHRRDARRIAIEAAGHDPRHPPMHALEAAPIVAAAFRLVAAGRAAVDGDVSVGNGKVRLKATITSPTGGIAILAPGRIEIRTGGGPFPETMTTALAGRALGDAVRLPECGDAAVDAAVRGLRIVAARPSPRGAIVDVAPARVIEMAPTPPGEDGRWKTMEPVPEA